MNIALSQVGDVSNYLVGNFYTMKLFIMFLKAAQDSDGFFRCWFRHNNCLETALQGSIFFDVLAIFVQGGGANHPHFATRKAGFRMFPASMAPSAAPAPTSK